LGRPVKWTDERSGSFVSDTAGRDAQMTAELALDAEGNFLAVRLAGYGNLGATYGAPGPATRNAVRNTLGVYQTPLIEVSTKCVFTTTTPVGAYRGAGRPEANYYMERLVRSAAVTIITGTLDYGQGHASPFAQVLSTRLGIPFRRIRLLQGDSDQLIAGGGTGGSKSMMTSGAAIVEAGDKVVEAGRQIAAHVLEAAAADIEFRAGRFTIAGTDRSVGLMELAEKLQAGLELPAGVPRSLDVQNISDGPPSAFPNGCHIAEVEVDPDTGVVDVVRYTFVNDFGVVINPLLVDGQAHGGIVQGIGQALREHTVYDAEGPLLTGSYMD